MRQTLSFESGQLEFADSQRPVGDTDVCFDGTAETREESDLCAFKPLCDVIVNGTAYSPTDTPLPTFSVRLAVSESSAAEPIADQSVRQLISKELQVSGPSMFRRKTLFERIANNLIKWGTAGYVDHPKWHRTQPSPIRYLPLRHEFTFVGGASVGAGVSRERTEFPAPQIEVPGASITAADFEDMRTRANIFEQADRYKIPSLGIRSKTDLERSRLLGSVDEAFVTSGRRLPADFDFHYFNAAQPDQQIPWPTGGELVELTNLCPHDTPGLANDSKGNKVFSFRLPTVECFVLIRMAQGAIDFRCLNIDTVIIEPSLRRVSLIWRAAVEVEASSEIRKCELRMRPRQGSTQLTASHCQQFSLDRETEMGFESAHDRSA